MADVRRHTLKHPLTMTFTAAGGATRQETIEVLEFPVGVRMRAKDLRCTDGHEGEVAKTIALIAHFSGHPVKVIDELDAEDFAALAEIIEGFQTGQATGPRTGQTS